MYLMLTCARNDEEGIVYAKEVLELVTADILVKDLPKQTELKDIVLKPNEKRFLSSMKLQKYQLPILNSSKIR